MTGDAKFRLAADDLGPEEIDAAIATLRSGRLTMGETVREFEGALGEWLGVRHVVMVNSGSSANLLLVDSLLRRLDPRHERLKPGDEVLVPALAWPTTVWPLLQLGLVPVYADVTADTMALDLESAASTLSPRTRGLFLIHPLGRACPMGPYVDFCARHGLVLMEDCCETLGAFDGGHHVGTFGHGGTLSHFYSHHLTTIEGGAVVTGDDALADDLRSARAHGWIRDRSDRERLAAARPDIDPRFHFVMAGYNVRPTETHAAIGLVQLGRMDEALRSREALARQVHGWMSKSAPWVRLVGSETLAEAPADRRSRRHSWMTLPFIVDPKAPASLAGVKAKLEANGVETRPIIAGNLTRHPASRPGTFRAAPRLSTADLLLERGFMIGCPPRPSPASVETLHKAIVALGS